ncbi:MAG: Xaa-Pro peptidase family protein [Oscillospiraceae bacterium]
MVQRVLECMSARNLQSFFISNIHNVRYVSGYTSSDAYLLICQDGPYFITDPRYTEQAEAECKDFKIVNWKDIGTSLGDAVATLAKKHGITQIGFEGCMNFNTYNAIKTTLGNVELVEVGGIIEKFRQIKSPYEIQCQIKACEISCRAFDRILNDIKVGVTEKEIAAKLCYYMVNEGADSQPYGDIVISGSRTSLLHGIPSDKKIEKGDFVLMDYGCAYNGYLSDMTRTVVVGKASDEQKKIYNLERQMIEDSLAVMKAGTKGSDVYKASIKAIENTEYLKYHYSGIGHGIGRYVHEDLFMSPKCESKLQENMVTTIEPGLYIPSWGGVRIEDQVIITSDGHINIVTATKDLIEL